MRKSHSYSDNHKVVKDHPCGHKAKKMADGGRVAPDARKNMKPPKKAAGGPPKRIGEGMNSPGGPKTPGAKGTYPKK